MKEIWKNIKGFEGLYQISNLGRVKSLPRKVKRVNNTHIVTKERIIKSRINNKGNVTVSLRKNDQYHEYTLNTLVYIHFVEDVDLFKTSKFVVININGDKTNCSPGNLKLVNRRELQNIASLKKKKSSKYPGIVWDNNKRKWKAVIRINNIRKFLGYYEDEAEAATAYQKEKLKQDIIDQNELKNKL